MPDSLNLNSIPKIMPKEDSWNKVLLRINAEKGAKIIPFRLYSIASVAASLLFVIGGIFLGISSNQGNLDSSFESNENVETLSWYASLGEGASMEEFSSILDSINKGGSGMNKSIKLLIASIIILACSVGFLLERLFFKAPLL